MSDTNLYRKPDDDGPVQDAALDSQYKVRCALTGLLSAAVLPVWFGSIPRCSDDLCCRAGTRRHRSRVGMDLFHNQTVGFIKVNSSLLLACALPTGAVR